MKIWYFHDQYNIKQIVWEKIKYLIIFLIYVIWAKVAAHFQKRKKIPIYLFKYPNKESGTILKNEAAEPYLEPCQISIMECITS